MEDLTIYRIKTRRSILCALNLLALIAGLLVASATFGNERIDPETGKKIFRSHAITLYDEAPKYPANFTHFDYVNADAPKGGSIVHGSQGAFNSFNGFIQKGEAASTRSVETLMTSSLDEPFTEYGLLASEIEWPEDRSWVIFHMNPDARWHDGKPVTADDVVWSFETLISKGDPSYQYYYGSVKDVEKLDDMSVRFNFNESNNRELPMILGQLPVLPSHYWASRNFQEVTLDPPLGSGPYRIKDFEAGRHIVYERVKDYWGANHPTNVGTNNFDQVEMRYYLDAGSMRLAVKAGEIDFRIENQAKAWAVDYDIAATEKGWLRKEVFNTSTPQGMVGLLMNTRRDKFSDIRVRKALILGYDFEWTNKNMFFGQYTRVESFFDNSDMKATGQPAGEELRVLEQFKEQLPEAVFSAPVDNPATDASGWLRDNLLEASRLLDEAGWVIKDLKRVNAQTGEPFTLEIITTQAGFERLLLPYIRNLKRLGIDGSLRLIDTSQYIERVRKFDFDMFYSGWGQSASPGNEQRNYWTTSSADREASRNYLGVKNPAIDEIVELLIQSDTRDALNERTRALDRVLRAGHYVVPGWYLPADRVIFWDKFGFPAATKYGVVDSTWWEDPARAKKLAEARESDESLTTDSADTNGETDRPGAWTIFLVLGALIVIGWWLIRRFLSKPNREMNR